MVCQASSPWAELAWQVGRLGCFGIRLWLVSDTSPCRACEISEHLPTTDVDFFDVHEKKCVANMRFMRSMGTVESEPTRKPPEKFPCVKIISVEDFANTLSVFL